VASTSSLAPKTLRALCAWVAWGRELPALCTALLDIDPGWKRHH
jgi:hypothetical protein